MGCVIGGLAVIGKHEQRGLDVKRYFKRVPGGCQRAADFGGSIRKYR
jgi:hypothetical protein